MNVVGRNYDIEFEASQNQNDVSGKMIIKYEYLGANTVVQQEVNGNISDNIVTLFGSSFSYIEKGNAINYHADDFHLVLSEDLHNLTGTSISGATTEKGKVSFNKNQV